MTSDQNFVNWFFHISPSKNSHCFSSEEVVQLQGKRCVVLHDQMWYLLSIFKHWQGLHELELGGGGQALSSIGNAFMR